MEESVADKVRNTKHTGGTCNIGSSYDIEKAKRSRGIKDIRAHPQSYSLPKMLVNLIENSDIPYRLRLKYKHKK